MQVAREHGSQSIKRKIFVGCVHTRAYKHKAKLTSELGNM